MATKQLTRLELYTQAIEELEEAFAALDQAHDSMKAAGVDDVQSGVFQESPTLKKILGQVTGLIQELKTAECDECGHALSKHADVSGCEHERVDEAPCGCDWMSGLAGRAAA